MYTEGGFEALPKHNRKGFKPSVFNRQQHQHLLLWLHNPHHALHGYKELMQWVHEKLHVAVKYTCSYQQVSQSTYLFGASSPITGDHVVWEMPCCSTYTFQTFSDEFSVHHPDEFKILVPDNAAFHKSGDLKIPSNMHLFYLPPFGPEQNPAE